MNDEQLDAIQAVVHRAGDLETRANELYDQVGDWCTEAQELLQLGAELMFAVQGVEDDGTGRIDTMALLAARAAFDAGALSMLLDRSKEDLLGFLDTWDMNSDEDIPAFFSLGRCALLAKNASVAALEAAGLND